MAYPSKTNREAILSLAVAIVEKDGLQGLSLRALAATLEVAPNALYRYFPNRSVLEAAIAGEVSRRLWNEMERGIRTDDPRQVIRDIARSYLAFARRQPHLYEILLRPCGNLPEGTDSEENLWDFVVRNVAALTGPRQAGEAAGALWAFLHGMAQLGDVKNLEKPEASFEFGLNAWLAKSGSEEM